MPWSREGAPHGGGLVSGSSGTEPVRVGTLSVGPACAHGRSDRLPSAEHSLGQVLLQGVGPTLGLGRWETFPTGDGALVMSEASRTGRPDYGDLNGGRVYKGRGLDGERGFLTGK